MRPRLPEHVERLLSTRIRSLGELEVLLLLHRDPAREWTAEQVNDALRTSLHAARMSLAHLRDVRLVEERPGDPPTYRFHPERSEDEATVTELVAIFRDRVSSVIDVIYPPKRDALRDFAEAFRISKKGDDNDG